ncbi:sel1 repeat family protein [bacterium]|nr:MAG: sel1 repeat family protein [bacterium]
MDRLRRFILDYVNQFVKINLVLFLRPVRGGSTILINGGRNKGIGLWIALLVFCACISLTTICQAANVSDGHVAFARKDYAEAMEILKPFAEQGDTQAQVKVGFMYFYGEGVDQDYRKASFWLSHAAEKENPIALTMLAKMYNYGWGVEEDPARAFTLCKRAAKNGYADAQAHLGILYAEGLGVGKSNSAAVDWLYKAGISYLSASKREMALSMVDTIREISPDNFLIYKLLNEIYDETGENHKEP